MIGLISGILVVPSYAATPSLTHYSTPQPQEYKGQLSETPYDRICIFDIDTDGTAPAGRMSLE